MLKGSSKIVSHFSLLFCSFWEISKSIAPRVIVQSYFKRNLIPKELQILEKADTAFISASLSITAENFNTIMHPGLEACQVQHTPTIWENKVAVSQD